MIRRNRLVAQLFSTMMVISVLVVQLTVVALIILSGVFSDAAFGALGGPGLVVNANNPPDSLTLTSDIIPPSDLVPPSSFSLAFTNRNASTVN